LPNARQGLLDKQGKKLETIHLAEVLTSKWKKRKKSFRRFRKYTDSCSKTICGDLRNLRIVL